MDFITYFLNSDLVYIYIAAATSPVKTASVISPTKTAAAIKTMLPKEIPIITTSKMLAYNTSTTNSKVEPYTKMITTSRVAVFPTNAMTSAVLASEITPTVSIAKRYKQFKFLFQINLRLGWWPFVLM